MNVLTVGPSLSLNNSLSEYHRQIVESLSVNHVVNSIVLNHDTSYFLPNLDGFYYYKNNQIYPFLNDNSALPKFVSETMKTFHPNIIITVDPNPKNHIYISYLKTLYPHIFKWIAVLPGNYDCNEFNYFLNQADCVVFSNSQSLNETSSLAIPKYYLPISIENTDLKTIKKEFNLVYSCKYLNNTNNLYNLEKIVKELDIKCFLHIDNNLINKEFHSNIIVNKCFISEKDGISKESLYSWYNNGLVYCNLSMESKTGINVLESMAAGCIPVSSSFGAAFDIMSLIPKEFRFFVEYEKIKMDNCYYSVVNYSHLKDILLKIKKDIWEKNIYNDVSVKMREIALNFKKDYFCCNLNKIIEEVVKKDLHVIIEKY